MLQYIYIYRHRLYIPHEPSGENPLDLKHEKKKGKAIPATDHG
jgi:hypothetical protein